jgi:hypothetical protein
MPQTPPASSLWRRQDEDIFPLTKTNLHDISSSDLDESTGVNLGAIQGCPVATLEIDDIRPHPPVSVTKLIDLVRVSKLDDSMLLTRAWMFYRQIHNSRFSAQEPA